MTWYTLYVKMDLTEKYLNSFAAMLGPEYEVVCPRHCEITEGRAVYEYVFKNYIYIRGLYPVRIQKVADQLFYTPELLKSGSKYAAMTDAEFKSWIDSVYSKLKAPEGPEINCMVYPMRGPFKNHAVLVVNKETECFIGITLYNGTYMRLPFKYTDILE